MLIYLVGFIIVWIFCKFYRNRNNENEWEDVGLTIFLSLFSWITLIGIILLTILVNVLEFLDKRDPPKWL